MTLEQDPAPDLDLLVQFINDHEIPTRLFLRAKATTTDPTSKNIFQFAEGMPPVFNRPKVKAQRLRVANNGAAIPGILCVGRVNLTTGTIRIAISREPVGDQTASSPTKDFETPPTELEPQPSGFSTLGSKAPIRGHFFITSAQMHSLCKGRFAPYDLYADAIVEDAAKYQLNPLFVLADIVNQGVNPAYRNPWGISTDNYPYGPGGTQLGQANGRVKNGPRKFSESEWRTAFDRQFSFVATGGAYAKATTIAEWAKIDAPPRAKNDINGTNAREGDDVGALYNQLVRYFIKLQAV